MTHSRFLVPEWIHELPDGRLQLVAQRCRACGIREFPPSDACKRCSSEDLEELLLEPEGTLYSVTVYRASSSADRYKIVGQVEFGHKVFAQGYVVGDSSRPPGIGTRMNVIPFELQMRDGEAVATYGFATK
jgi:uncharacterized OB-fold protein